MRNRLLAALIGIGAGFLLLAAYAAFRYFGKGLGAEAAMVVAAAAAVASAVGVFALAILDRPAGRNGRAVIKLNEEPATRFIYPFRGENIAQILARPDMPLAMMLARFGDTFRREPQAMTKDITVTIKGSKKGPFPTLTLQQLFLTLKPFRLEHVLLLGEKDEFIGYIPGKRAAKEFTGDNAADKITKYVVGPLDKPDESGVLREIGGVPEPDTVKDTDDLRYAEAMLWANESVNGLIVKHKAKLVGVISKVDILRLSSGQP